MAGRARSLRRERARRLAERRNNSRISQNFDIEINKLSQLISLASGGGRGAVPESQARTYYTGGKRGKAPYTGLVRLKGGGLVFQYVTPRPQRIGRRFPTVTRVSVPSASQIPALQRALAIKQAEKDVFSARANLNNVNRLPVSLAVPSKRFGGGVVRGLKADYIREQNENKAVVSQKHGARVRLWNAQKNLAKARGQSFNESPPEAPWIIKSSADKISTLSKQTGFDIGAQLKKTNDRFGLGIGIDDITASYTSGGLLGEAKNIFERNRKIDKLKDELVVVGPQTETVDDNSDFPFLLERRQSIVDQQQQRINEINQIQDQDLKIARLEKEPQVFKNRADFIDTKITALEGRISDIQKTRKPVNLLTGTGSLADFRIKSMVERRNTLAKLRNEKVDEFNLITDPALRSVAKMQDLPSLDNRIGQIDSDIDRAVKFGQEREQVNIDILNEKVRRGRQPKFFTVKINGEERKFRRTGRGAKQAQSFFEASKKQKETELSKITDPVLQATAREQDIGTLDFGIKVSKTQRQQINQERRQANEDLGGGGAGADFLPFTPTDSPSGQLAIQPIPKQQGTPKVFSAVQDFSTAGAVESAFGGTGTRGGRGRGRGRSIDPNSFDVGNLFGGRSTRINRKQSGGFDFF